jgi:predicted PurR-regulated permease PerM
MIPVVVKAALSRARSLEPDDPDDVPVAVDSGDVVVRYALVCIALVMGAAALSISKAIAIPVAAGVILGLVLGPPVDRLTRLGIPAALGAALLVGGAVLVLIVLIGLFAAPFAIWSDRLPAIVVALKQRAAELLTILKPVAALGEGLPPADGSMPRVVAVDNGTPWFSIAATSTSIAGGLLITLATLYFYLATRRQLKARALRLCFGPLARRKAGRFLADLEDRIAGYFGVVTVINLGMGAATTLIAWLSGVPFPLFWGLLAFLLNYIAFVGPIIMTALLVGAGLVDNQSLLLSLIPAVAYLVLHLIEGNVVTPLAVGRRLTVNPFLVFLSFVFWLWLWGPMGAILATPLLLVGSLGVDAWRAFREADIADGSQSQPITLWDAADDAKRPSAREL